MEALIALVVVLGGAVLLYLLFAFGVFGAGLASSRNGKRDDARRQPPGPTRDQER